MHPIKYTLLIVFVTLFVASCSTSKKNLGNDHELYTDAKEQLEDGDLEDAIETYDFLQSKYPFGVYTEQAWLDKGYAWFLQDSFNTAELEFNEFIHNFPNHKNLDYAFFMLAFLKESQAFSLSNTYINDPAKKDVSNYKQAVTRYKNFIRRFPESTYLTTAKQRIPALENRISRHELFVANYYSSRRAWVAVINRCQLIIDKYPTTPSSRKALVLMRDAYLQIDLPEIADDIQKVIDLNPVFSVN